MKKFLLCLVMPIVFSASVYSADYYSVGVDAYYKGRFDAAASNLEHSVRINTKNVNARYFLAQAYIRQNRISDAINQYNRIILLAPSSDAAKLSAKGLSLIKQSESGVKVAEASVGGSSANNYLDYVVADDGDIKRWAAFPLTVYVQPSRHRQTVLRAFQQWQSKSHNLVSFNVTNSPQHAKILVDFRNKLETTSTKESYIAGYSTPQYEGIHIAKSDIHLLTINPDTGKEFDDNFIYATALHELGHSLGFAGHSPNENDVMSASSTTPKTQLTSRDVNTLIAFYKIDRKTYLAKKSGGGSVKLNEALGYVKKFPQKSVGWANLGDIYYNRHQYQGAIKCYKKAIAIEPDKANLYNSLGVSYRLSGDKQNACYSFKHACDLDKSSEFYLRQFVASSQEIGRNDLARSYISAYLKANPQAASSEKFRKLMQSTNR